jgi:hypothetical protein
MMPMAEYYCVKHISILEGDSHVRILGKMFEWMDLKGYSQYNVRIDS